MLDFNRLISLADFSPRCVQVLNRVGITYIRHLYNIGVHSFRGVLGITDRDLAQLSHVLMRADRRRLVLQEGDRLEARNENRLCKAVRKIGGICRKFTSPGYRSAPDRLVMLERGRPIFVELKRAGAVVSPLQFEEHCKYRALGFRVEVLDTYPLIDQFMEDIT